MNFGKIIASTKYPATHSRPPETPDARTPKETCSKASFRISEARAGMIANHFDCSSTSAYRRGNRLVPDRHPKLPFTMSAALAAARNISASHSERAKPKAAIATPHNAAAHVIASPWRPAGWTRLYGCWLGKAVLGQIAL